MPACQTSRPQQRTSSVARVVRNTVPPTFSWTNLPEAPGPSWPGSAQAAPDSCHRNELQVAPTALHSARQQRDDFKQIVVQGRRRSTWA